MELKAILNGRPDEAIRQFLHAWYGSQRGSIRTVDDGRLPAPLRQLAALAQAWPLFHQNRLDTTGPIENDKQIFYIENQGVCAWAFDVDAGDDPSVHVRFGWADEPWLVESEPLSRFLLQVVTFEAVMGSTAQANAPIANAQQREAVLAATQPLPWGIWRWPADPTRFHAGVDILAVENAAPGDEWIWVAGRTGASLAYLREIAGVEWAAGPWMVGDQGARRG